MYRAKFETNITVKTVNQDREFSVQKITVPENLNGEDALKKVRATYTPEKGIVILWNTATVQEIVKIPYEMDDAKFFELAKKMEKPNPAYISRSVNSTEVKVEVVHDDDTFTKETLMIDTKLPKENPEKVIDGYIKNGYLFNVLGVKCVSGLFGMKQETYFENATPGEKEIVYKA